MDITKTSSEAQRERDEANKLIYRRIKARGQGYVCPECGKSHWTPNIIEHYKECEHYFKFACESCGCEWKSNVYAVNWSQLYALEAKVPARDLISWWWIKNKFKRSFKHDMKALEDGYDPAVDYNEKDKEEINKIELASKEVDNNK